ncbi:MAG: AtpZ/AtpI family protein [Candidatus Saccharibacteria bacterium]|nr:AtpZ/AtpI family protein [Candidatus Saccharibacteria bacterium]
MSGKAKKDTTPSANDVLVLFGTVADTTWRMFVPTLLGLALGLWADSTYNSKPLWTLVGVFVGVAVCLGLIFVQMKGLKK